VTNGIFAVNLDFGANSFNGGARYLEISVRADGSGQGFTTLNPRQPVTSTPYAVRALNAASADLSVNSQKLGGTDANQFVLTTDARMSDARTPTPGSPNYIQNGTLQQAAANFNIAGEGRQRTLTRSKAIESTAQKF
jgi:hypothetical protein